MSCKICDRNLELRFGVCWDCATMESIIADGVDMYDKGPDGSNTPARTAMEKLQYMHKVGVGYFYSPAPVTKQSMFAKVKKMVFNA